ncbi:D-ribose pyranase [Erysipelotrichaceae bacterium OttesenSCG-928-M19]|nr:D-ribose pyranase [Erysipelotrichaceae bacterium OttesenSCG-928-M19]
MKKNGILNREINDVLGKLGHTDTICIGDCGLPLPKGIKVVDLTLKIGIPSFMDVLQVIIEEMQIESYVLASEIKEKNKKLVNEIENNALKDLPHTFVSHEEFKVMTKDCQLIIRTGEANPYANIILQGGVIF